MAKRKNRFRKSDSYSRKRGKRKPRKSILLVCEGEKTEPIYFRAIQSELKISTLELVIEPGGGSPRRIVEKAIELKNRQEREARRAQKRGETFTVSYDEVWCVFDVENPAKNPEFRPAVELAQGNDIYLGISNPAFEFWFLLHYSYTNRPFENADKLIRELKTHLPEYEKSLDVFPKIYPQTETAIQRAKKCISNHPDGAPFPNSSTEVYRIVEELINMRIY